MNERRLAYPKEHPAFAGHFPGHPVVPGALLIAEALQALDAAGIDTRGCSVSSAKFLSPVVPGETVTLRWESANGATLPARLEVGTRLVASLVIGLRASGGEGGPRPAAPVAGA